MGHINKFAKGQIAILMTLAAATLGGAIALGADVTVLYFNYVKMQSAADSAVLAGCHFLPVSPDTARTTTIAYAQTDGIASGEIDSIAVTNSNIQVAMTATRVIPYTFGRLIGLTTGKVTVTATAGLEASGSALGSPNLVPLGIQCPQHNCQPGQTYSFAPPLIAPLLGAGSWVPVSFSNNEGTLLSTILNGYQGVEGQLNLPVSVGESVATALGDANYRNDTGTALTSRISAGVFANPNGTALTHVAGDPRLIEVPVMSFNPLNLLSQSVPVTGFAQLWITTGAWGGSNGIITATLVNGVAANNVPNVAAVNAGAYVPVLIK
jgi:hypothetical protein